MSFSFEELDRLIREISSGQKPCVIINGRGEEQVVLLRHCTNEDQLYSEWVYQRSLKEATDMGLASLEDMEELIRVRGFFGKKEEEEVESLRSRIKGQEFLLSKTTRVPLRINKIKDNIKNLENLLRELILKKERTLEFTRERKALEAKLLYLTYRGVFSFDTKTPYWLDYNAFCSEKDLLFRAKVFYDFTVFSHGMKVEVIREIARSNLWRVRYVTATKTSDSLFNRPISDYTVDQLMLMYWSHFYQSVLEMSSDERPDQSVIDDDATLDAYMKNWQEEKNRDDVAHRAQRKQGGNNSAWDHSEQIVTRSNPNFENIEYSPTLVGSVKDDGQASIDAAPTNRSKGQGKSRLF